MKWPLGITLTFLLILQNFQQVSTQISDELEKSNVTTLEGDNGKEPSGEETTAVPIEGSEGDPQSNEYTQANPTTSGLSNGLHLYNESEKLELNSSKIEQIPEATLGLPVNGTEEVSSFGPLVTITPPLMIPLNSSIEISDTSAESNETQTEWSASNTPTPEPEQTSQTTSKNTYTSSNPDPTTAQSSPDEPGSGYLPSEVEPANGTTKSPTSTTKDMMYRTTVTPSEPPVYTTTKPVIPPAVPEEVTTAAPDNQTGPFDSRGNSERGLSSDVTEQNEKKGQGLAIILGIGLFVGVIALAAFIVINQRNKRDFSHRKLVEEMSPDPVLRLENIEPLDLKFDGFGYHNPGLEGDNIQMTNFPHGHSN